MSTVFRAPGSALSLGELIARALPGADAASLVETSGVRIAGRPARKLKTRVPPGTLVEIAAETPDVSLASAASWRILVPSLPWRAGTLEPGGVAFERLREQDGVVELLARGDARELRARLADAGHPVLGDAEHRGILVAGGIRLEPVETPPRPGWWPEEPVFPRKGPDDALLLEVSRATCRILSRGHPWILRDEETSDPARFAPGTRVGVVGPAGEDLGTAHIEGAGRLTARIWTPAGGRDASVEARVSAALARRTSLLEAKDTDAYRLVHGEADGLPGLFVDRLGSLLRLLVTSPGTFAYRGRALDAIVRALSNELGGDPPIVEVLHLRDRPNGKLECTRLASGNPAAVASEPIVLERGVRFRVDSGLDRPQRASPGVGLYLDQRENRARLLASAAGGRLLNLFAHTGAFSVAWLAAGRREAVSVDLSGAYLRWLEQNLALNGIDPGRHHGVKQDGRRFLETLAPEERFDAIVVDPPTAAAAGRRFWSVAKELPPLVGRALRHLSPGGTLLVSRNDRRRAELRELVEGAARNAGVSLANVQPAPPGADFPRLSGFPEGDPFSALIATLPSG